jgi:CheY-like chemotaxis protein
MSVVYIDGIAPTPARMWFGSLPLNAPEVASVLIVDDDVLVGDMYRLVLSRAGYSVVVARDGSEGLRMAETAAPDIIFLDIRMPGMDGLEVLRQLSANSATRDIPVVMLSNYDANQYLTESVRLGAKQYLVKAGINPADLVEVVSRWRRKSTD